MKPLRRSVSTIILSIGLASFSRVAAGDLTDGQQVQHFPQVADGAGFITTWQFTGLGLGPNVVTLELFVPDGSPLVVSTDYGTNSSFQIALDGAASASIRTKGLGTSVKVGWAKVSSTYAIGATESYQLLGSDSRLISQASVLSADPIQAGTILALDARNTALALLNPDSSGTTFTFRLLDSHGLLVGPPSSMNLPSGNQIALYVNQIPGYQSAAAIGGSLEISAPSKFSLVTLVFSGQTFASAPVLPGRMALTPPRNDILREINSLQQSVTDNINLFLGPAREDVTLYADFLTQPQTGLTRLLPRETFDPSFPISGGGAYYSFARLTHEYGYGSDICLERSHLSVGFSGINFGFLTNLGDVPVDQVSLATAALQYLATYTPPTVEADARAEYQRAQAGFNAGAFFYAARLQAVERTTYALRSINYNPEGSDVLVGLRIVRFDTDGSAIIAWKLLKRFPAPNAQ